MDLIPLFSYLERGIICLSSSVFGLSCICKGNSHKLGKIIFMLGVKLYKMLWSFERKNWV